MVKLTVLYGHPRLEIVVALIRTALLPHNSCITIRSG